MRQRREANRLLTPFGLDFDRPPAKSFRHIAHRYSSISLCRNVNTIHMMRLCCCDLAYKQINILLESPTVKDNDAARDGWISFQRTLEDISRAEADLILASLPFYIFPGHSALSSISVSPLIWPLSNFGAYEQLAPTQQARAKDALLQIGKRAMIPLAIKLADLQFQPNAEAAQDAHMLHLAWHF
jgi:hypothetical protein